MKESLRHIAEGSTYQGFEIFEVEHRLFYSFLKLKRNKGELSVLHESTSDSMEAVILKIDRKAPLVLVINTLKILKRQIAADLEGTAATLVSRAFPDLELDNFHFDILESPRFKVVSLAKKSVVEETLELLKKHGIQPTKIHLGTSALKNALEYLEYPVRGSNFKIDLDGSGGLILENTESMPQDNTDIEGLVISRTNLLPFSAILGYITRARDVSNLSMINGALDNGFKNGRIFKLGLQLGLGGILGILLLNFLLYAHYRDKTLGMDSAPSLELQTQILEETKERVDLKESKLDALMGSSSSRATYYLDRLAHSMPNGIILDELDYQPLARAVREGKAIEVFKGNLTITGKTGQKEALTQWTDSLDKMEWVKTIDILNYEYISSLSDGFSLKIELDETGQ